MSEWFQRLRDWIRRDQLRDELAEELRFHEDRLAEEATAHGVMPDAASRTARQRMGNRTRVHEAAWDRWSWPWLDHFLFDFRHTLRGLRRSPAFTATVIVTLGLGIGANTAMFGIVDRLVLRPLPLLRDPSTVHRVYWHVWERETESIQSFTEYKRYLDFVRETTSFAQHAAFANRILAVGTENPTNELVGMVGGTFFDFFDAQPALGRFFTPAEDMIPRGASVAVLGHAFWMSRYGGRNVLGQMIQVHNVRAEIVGVAPPGFVGVNDNAGPSVFIPITTYAASLSDRAATYYTTYARRWIEVMVRRKPEADLSEATADATRAAIISWNSRRALEPWLAGPEVARPSAELEAIKLEAGPYRGIQTRVMFWVTGVAFVVLVIACANVANLYLLRALLHRREATLRVALGASRVRLFVQMLTGSLVLSGLGCLAGLLAAHWGSAAIGGLVRMDGGEPLAVSADWRMLAAAAAYAMAAGLVTGLAPALLVGRRDLISGLRDGGRSGEVPHRSSVRTMLVVTQAALSVVLLVGAGLFVRSLDRAREVSLGYDAERVLLVSSVLRGVTLDDSAQVRLGRTLLETAQTMGTVQSASWASTAPFWITNSTRLYVPGIDSVERLGHFTYQTSTTDYFRTMGTRILRGRGFLPDDRAGAQHVAVVSEDMAATLWPGREALGQCIRPWADTMPCATVVGVAENIVQENLRATRRLHYYLPVEQFPPTVGTELLLRMRGDPAAQAEEVRRVLQDVMPGLSYVTVQPLADLVRRVLRSWRVGATMFVAFGSLALIVAAVGLYGVVSYTVAARRHELGVCVAMGARSRHLIGLVTTHALSLAAGGILVGSVLAFGAARWVEPLLFRQSPRDPVVYAMVGVTLVVVALLASIIPAMHAARADPNSVLRGD